MDKYIVSVGVNDELVAHLRLLLRRLSSAPGAQNWIWGNEDNADLVVVGLDSYIGRMARDRAGTRGRRCAVVSYSEPLRANEVRCAPPFSAASISSLLAAVNEPVEARAPGAPRPDDPFADEVEQLASITDIPPDSRAADAGGGLEELLQKEHDVDRFMPDAIKLRADTTIEQMQRVSKRAENHASFEPGDLDVSARTAERIDSFRTHFALAKFVDGNLLSAPAILALPGLPTLALDPKNRKFYSNAATMQELIEYCTRPLPLAEWRPLTSADLATERSAHKERPYEHLAWLQAWLNSKGRLASHLSPGADFRLNREPDIDDGAPGHAAINEALVVPGRLHVIAQSSGASMNDVIDLINAYDAIGWIEAVRDRPPSAPAPAKGGLLGKLGLRRR